MATSDIEFQTLTLRDALDVAILIEEEAEERYEELAEQMEVHHTPEAASFFHLMSQREASHGSELRERRQRLFPGPGRKVSRSMLWDVKAPEYDQVHAFMTLREAIHTALAAEEKAEAFFESAIRQVRDAEVRALFAELRGDEARVHDQLEHEMAELPPEREEGAEDVGDEPVAQ